MTRPEDVLAFAALGSLLLLVLGTWLTRVGPILITMGLSDGRVESDELKTLVAKAALRQSEVSFWLMILAGAAAAIVLFVAIVLALVRNDASASAGMVSVICGLGNSALFRYYLQVWRESRKVLDKLGRAR